MYAFFLKEIGAGNLGSEKISKSFLVGWIEKGQSQINNYVFTQKPLSMHLKSCLLFSKQQRKSDDSIGLVIIFLTDQSPMWKQNKCTMIRNPIVRTVRRIFVSKILNALLDPNHYISIYWYGNCVKDNDHYLNVNKYAMSVGGEKIRRVNQTFEWNGCVTKYMKD